MNEDQLSKPNDTRARTIGFALAMAAIAFMGSWSPIVAAAVAFAIAYRFAIPKPDEE